MNIKNKIALLLIFLCSCNTTKKTATEVKTNAVKEEVNIAETPVYRASNPLTNDLLHTHLEISFNWDKKQLYGKATLTLTPYFYPVSILYLNARGMELHEVSLCKGEIKTPLKYFYQNDSITISLDKTYKRGEQYTIFIDYTSKPYDLEKNGSEAISDDRGLYFINADGKEKDKPMQIWSQGETQSNSVWFPTIDSPNERMTQEIYITIDSVFITLSNGLMLSSTNNHDGTKTDYWKQSLPAAPYLTMIAIGKYAVVKDKWRTIDVNYYVEPEYEPYARLVFGHTPEMLEFFSNKLGVDYPWEKFSQVVVRDYVSGAMENTTAVVHGEYLQRNSREYLDNTNEDVISHELFHHWFGDLVTCESWSNVPLNESFATYGQYLWNEYKYGRDEADYGNQQDLNEYLTVGLRGPGPHLIRYNYESREELFDNISYQKGARILHMLRKIIGDDAFFIALKLYLQTNKFHAVEVAHLRLAFEEITGQDLNWFFNEWFFNGGHPELNLTYHYNDSLKTQFIYTEQTQGPENTLVYTLPVAVDLYYGDKNIRKEIVLKNQKDTFSFEAPEKPFLVNFDAEKMLLAVKTDVHSTDEWIYMYNHGQLYLDRYEALSKLSKNYTAESPAGSVIMSALLDKHWNLRSMALKNIGTMATSDRNSDEIKKTLLTLAEMDIKSDVRSNALKALAKNYKDVGLDEVFKKATGDSSYDVMGEAIRIYVARNKKISLEWLRQFESTESSHISGIIAGIYANEGNDENNDYFIGTLRSAQGFGKYKLVSEYAKFLARCNASSIQKGIPLIEDVARNAKLWWIRMSGSQAMADVLKVCEDKSSILQNEIKEATSLNKPGIEIQSLENDKRKFDDLKVTIEEKIKDIKKNETDKNLKKLYH